MLLRFIGKNSHYKAGDVTFTKTDDTKTVTDKIGKLLLEKEPTKFIKVTPTKEDTKESEK